MKGAARGDDLIIHELSELLNKRVSVAKVQVAVEAMRLCIYGDPKDAVYLSRLIQQWVATV